MGGFKIIDSRLGIKYLFLFLICFTKSGFTQINNIKNLVFEGAGIRGLAYVGALKSLDEQGILENIEKVGGTSAGAITALLLSLGYTPEELETIISETKFQKFNDGRFFFIGGFYRTKNRFGWYRGQKFTKWIGTLIAEKTGNSDINLAELHQLGYKDLYAAAICLNKQKLVILSHESYPKMKVKDAVRISMSIPLYYQAVFIDSIGQVYPKQNKNNTLNIMIDGGITGNFPIHIFDEIKIDSEGKEYRMANHETLGIRIDEDLQIKEDNSSKKLAPQTISNFGDYISAFYIMIIENLNRNNLTEDDWNRTVSVSSVGIGPKVKRLSFTQKKKLIDSGRKDMDKWIVTNTPLFK